MPAAISAAEEEVFAARGEDQLIEPQFVDGQGIGVPFGNALGLMSTTVILYFGHLWAIMAIVGPPTYPAPIQRIFLFIVIVLPLQCCHSSPSFRWSDIKEISNYPPEIFDGFGEAFHQGDTGLPAQLFLC